MVKILIDGVDKTKEIESCEPINNGYSIKYKNSDKKYNYSEKRVQIEGNSSWQNNLNYFKELASKISIVIKNYNVLEDRYKNLSNLNKDSILKFYLKGTLPPSNKQINHVRFPFGFNQSQKLATERALKKRLSVIEGPPGTGKTQTILNIIANLIMDGKTVAVVSNNNAATQNVYDKLKKQDLDFLVAFLGKDENKTEFIENQQELPNLDTWLLDDDKAEKIEKILINKLC